MKEPIAWPKILHASTLTKVKPVGSLVLTLEHDYDLMCLTITGLVVDRITPLRQSIP
jgi:hypothetical protein